MKRIYLDHAATTPLDPEVIAHMSALMAEVTGNPSSIHAEGRRARTVIEEARARVARLLNASIGEIFFTSGGTESSNMILKTAHRDRGIRRFISSPTEHHCVLHTLQRLGREPDTEVLWLQTDAHGSPDLSQLETLLAHSPTPTLVSLMHANNETGALLDLERAGRICRAHGALFHSDTVQTMGYFPFDLEALPIDMMTGSGHKFYGPKGCGFVYIRGGTLDQPLMDGGSQERNMRAGTENVYGISGLALALSLAYEHLESRQSQTRAVRAHLLQRLTVEFPEITVHSPSPDHCHYKVLNVSFPPSPRSEFLVMNLDISGISVSGGSACSSGTEKGSHVLEAIGMEADRKAVRFSFSHKNTIAEADRVIDALIKAFKKD